MAAVREKETNIFIGLIEAAVKPNDLSTKNLRIIESFYSKNFILVKKVLLSNQDFRF